MNKVLSHHIQLIDLLKRVRSLLANIQFHNGIFDLLTDSQQAEYVAVVHQLDSVLGVNAPIIPVGFEFGDSVLCRAEAFTSYDLEVARVSGYEAIHVPKSGRTKKILYRRPFEPAVVGMIIGYTYRDTGSYQAASFYVDDNDPPYLAIDKRHKLWMVATTLRWRTPILALEDDLTKVEEVIEG